MTERKGANFMPKMEFSDSLRGGGGEGGGKPPFMGFSFFLDIVYRGIGGMRGETGGG